MRSIRDAFRVGTCIKIVQSWSLLRIIIQQIDISLKVPCAGARGKRDEKKGKKDPGSGIKEAKKKESAAREIKGIRKSLKSAPSACSS